MVSTATVATLVAPAAAQAARPATQRVSFGGTSVTVPKSWPVVDLYADPTACVRLDRHAVYLGTPGANQDCPHGVLGHAAAVLLEPAGSATPTGVVDKPNMHQFERVAGGVRVVATYGADRDIALGIITKAASRTDATPGTATSSATPNATAEATTLVSTSATNYTGKGFDPCTAPSPSTMSTWLANSPYRAIGIYIGGENRGCSQPNLTASWVSQQAAAGWHFFLLYVGKQAASSSCSNCSKISSPVPDGTTAADDAVSQASALGFGVGTPIVFDMESYSSSSTTTVLQFLSAWSDELHARSYNSGVYSSSSSGIKDLATHYTSYTMPDMIDDALWNGVADTADSNIPSNLWANHQRIHQYSGGHNETYGGVTINIDQDYLDVQLSGPSFAGRQLADLNGDGRPELVGRNSSGALLAYPHLDTSAIAGSSWGTPIQIGSGWNGYDQIVFADLNNDSLPEIIARKPSVDGGGLFVYPHLAGVTTIAGSSWNAPVEIGTGWNTYDKIMLADLNMDGLPEIVARNPNSSNGALMAYPHVAGVTAIAGSSWTTAVNIGTGWNTFSMITLSDLNIDRSPELVAINANTGALVAYPHLAGVTTIAGTSWTTPIQIGSSWDQFDAFSTGDLNGDGLPEIVVRKPNTNNGTLIAYPHLAGVTTIAGTSWTTPIQIGTGWNIYTLLT
jgi:hypothetical protein